MFCSVREFISQGVFTCYILDAESQIWKDTNYFDGT